MMNHTPCLQGMYAIEMKDAPEFRKNMEDMLYAQAPSRFGINTAYVEVRYTREKWLFAAKNNALL